jgi:MoxR-like ATPase
MTGRFKVEELHTGGVHEATFYPNPQGDSGFRFRATHLDGKRAPKVVLCNDDGIPAGVPCQVRIKAITRPERTDRGVIEVTLEKALPFRLEGVWLDPIVSKRLQILLESGLNVLLDGPQGCGKTVIARAIATALSMEFVFFNCSAVVEATDFLATVQVRASSTGAPVTDFIKTEFLVALERARLEPHRRFLIFLDELNRCHEMARNVLMPALDATRRVYNPVDNVFLAIPPNVQFIAAVNRGTEFSGTFGIDAAQLDRFAPVQMTYPPPEEEVKLLATRHPELPRSLIETVVGIAHKVRGNPELAVGLSVRATDEACIILKHPLADGVELQMLPDVLRGSFCGRFSGRADDIGSDAGIVWSIIEGALP